MKKLILGLALVWLGALLASPPLEALTRLRRPGDPAVAGPIDKDALPPLAASVRNIPILALYTPERLAAAGTLALLRADLDDELLALNESLRMSGIVDYQFVFSAVTPADRHDSGTLNDDLTWLQSQWPLERIHAAGARLVHLFVGSGDFGGIANLPGYHGVSNQPSVAEVGRFVLAHEVGHNLGLSHDPDHAGDPPQPNGHAYRMAGYRDVMGYSEGCFEAFDAACPVFAGFSDPARVRRGYPLGILGVSEAVSVLRDALPYIAGDTSCFPSTNGLCLASKRFEVYTTWKTADLRTGLGTAIPRTADTGEFWFFASTNIETIVKVLDGCAVNGHYWVFAGGLTDVEVRIVVTDTLSGRVKVYSSPLGRAFQPIQDTGAFPCQ